MNKPRIKPMLVALDKVAMKFTTEYFIKNIHIHNSYFLNDIAVKLHTGKEFSLAYEQTYELLYGESLMGYLHALPNRKLYLGREVVFIEFKNDFLYDTQFAEAYSALLGCQELSLVFKCFTSLDIAIDTAENLLERFKWFEERKNTYTRNKKLDATYSESIDGVVLKPIAALYNKSSELLHSKKDYIKAFHEANLPAFSKVFRLEVRLNNRRLYNSKIPLDYTRLNDINYLLAIVQYFLNRDVYWTKKQGNRSTRHYLLEFDTANLPVLKKVEKSVSLSMTPTQVRLLLDKLVLAQVLLENCTVEEVQSTILDILRRYKMFTWEDKRWLGLYTKHLMFVQKQFVKLNTFQEAA